MSKIADIVITTVLSCCVGSSIMASVIWWKHKDEPKPERKR